MEKNIEKKVENIIKEIPFTKKHLYCNDIFIGGSDKYSSMKDYELLDAQHIETDKLQIAVFNYDYYHSFRDDKLSTTECRELKVIWGPKYDTFSKTFSQDYWTEDSSYPDRDMNWDIPILGEKRINNPDKDEFTDYSYKKINLKGLANGKVQIDIVNDDRNDVTRRYIFDPTGKERKMIQDHI